MIGISDQKILFLSLIYDHQNFLSYCATWTQIRLDKEGNKVVSFLCVCT